MTKSAAKAIRPDDRQLGTQLRSCAIYKEIDSASSRQPAEMVRRGELDEAGTARLDADTSPTGMQLVQIVQRVQRPDAVRDVTFSGRADDVFTDTAGFFGIES
ncbi:MAG TPA: hypothetical protein VF669_02545 [Tepidisphaeraceae bacterium]